MKIAFRFSALTLAALTLAAPRALLADEITYTVDDIYTGTINGSAATAAVTGKITTDGTIGTLAASNIVSWDLTSNGVTEFGNSTGPGFAEIFGNAVTASSSALTFNFSAGTNSISPSLLFENAAGSFCWQTSNVCTGLGSNNFSTDTTAGQFTGSSLIGVMTIATVAPVPLPTAAWLMLSALGGLGAFARKKRAS